jgi:hypothetical protein
VATRIDQLARAMTLTSVVNSDSVQLVDAIGGELGVFRSAQTFAGGLPHAVPVNVCTPTTMGACHVEQE